MMKPSRDAMLRRESGLRRVVGFGPGWMEDGTWVCPPAGGQTRRAR